jgi:hypothetical protein
MSNKRDTDCQESFAKLSAANEIPHGGTLRPGVPISELRTLDTNADDNSALRSWEALPAAVVVTGSSEELRSDQRLAQILGSGYLVMARRTSAAGCKTSAHLMIRYATIIPSKLRQIPRKIINSIG